MKNKKVMTKRNLLFSPPSYNRYNTGFFKACRFSKGQHLITFFKEVDALFIIRYSKPKFENHDMHKLTLPVVRSFDSKNFDAKIITVAQF